MWRSKLFCFCSIMIVASQMAHAEQRLLRFDITSQCLSTQRSVQVYLPPSYRQSNRRYPVLYLQDGQNLFSSAGTNICFGWGNWELDKTMDKLCRVGQLRELILVAID